MTMDFGQIETARAVFRGSSALPLAWKAVPLAKIGVSALVSRAIPSVTGVLKSASAPARSEPLFGAAPRTLSTVHATG